MIVPPPKQLGLQTSFRPQGYYTVFKQWPVYPNSSNQYWQANDVIRFYNTIDSGVMDPYRSSIQFTVQVNTTNQPVGLLQVDKMATSFFSQLVTSSRNVQIQRITQYDTLAAMLSDLGTSQVITQGRTFEGLGYSNQATNSNWLQSTAKSGQFTVNTGNTITNLTLIQNNNQSNVLPTRVGSYGGIFGQGAQSGLTNGSSVPGSVMTPYVVSGQTSSNCSLANYLWVGPGNTQGKNQSSQSQSQIMQSIQTTQGRFNNIRAEYNSLATLNNYPDSNISTLHINPQVQGQTWNVTTMMQNTNNSGFNPKAPYNLTYPQQQTTTWLDQTGVSLQSMTISQNAQNFGYQKPTCPQTSKSGNQAVISATVPLCQMVNGNILPTKVPVNQKRFVVPLFSSVCGVLIPPDQFILIQMKALRDLLLQMTLSPYAMFTSGYSDVHQFDTWGMSIQQKRSWTITQICWNIHLYTFQDSQINVKLNASLTKGIAITSAFYFLGNTFQIPNGQVVRNMWPISCQSQSLSQIYCVFLSNQYQKYSFCRKQFRLSNNITAMQVRLKTEFFPSQPIVGNAGNPQYNQGNPDNAPFLRQLYFSNNYLFNLNVPMPKINKINFAINGRCYNTANTNTFYPQDLYLNTNNSSIWSTPGSINLDTAMGMPYFHENRYIGMAVYSWTWDPYGHSSQYMNGINTAGNQNFGIQFATSPNNPFPTDQTLVIFCRSNGIVLYTENGIQTIGK